jgi:hypothetical protein
MVKPSRGEGNGGKELKQAYVSIYHEGLWYLAKTRCYPCPVCLGGQADALAKLKEVAPIIL